MKQAQLFRMLVVLAVMVTFPALFGCERNQSPSQSTESPAVMAVTSSAADFRAKLTAKFGRLTFRTLELTRAAIQKNSDVTGLTNTLRKEIQDLTELLGGTVGDELAAKVSALLESQSGFITDYARELKAKNTEAVQLSVSNQQAVAHDLAELFTSLGMKKDSTEPLLNAYAALVQDAINASVGQDINGSYTKEMEAFKLITESFSSQLATAIVTARPGKFE